MGIDTDQWNKLAEIEAQAVAEMLASNGRRVMVVVVSSTGEDGAFDVLHAIAGTTYRRHVEGFIIGLSRKLEFLKSKVGA